MPRGSLRALFAASLILAACDGARMTTSEPVAALADADVAPFGPPTELVTGSSMPDAPTRGSTDLGDSPIGCRGDEGRSTRALEHHHAAPGRGWPMSVTP